MYLRTDSSLEVPDDLTTKISVPPISARRIASNAYQPLKNLGDAVPSMDGMTLRLKTDVRKLMYHLEEDSISKCFVSHSYRIHEVHVNNWGQYRWGSTRGEMDHSTPGLVSALISGYASCASMVLSRGGRRTVRFTRSV